MKHAVHSSGCSTAARLSLVELRAVRRVRRARRAAVRTFYGIWVPWFAAVVYGVMPRYLSHADISSRQVDVLALLGIVGCFAGAAWTLSEGVTGWEISALRSAALLQIHSEEAGTADTVALIGTITVWLTSRGDSDFTRDFETVLASALSGVVAADLTLSDDAASALYRHLPGVGAAVQEQVIAYAIRRMDRRALPHVTRFARGRTNEDSPALTEALRFLALCGQDRTPSPASSLLRPGAPDNSGLVRPATMTDEVTEPERPPA